jgi:doublecortin-like kinase 1/2
MSPAHSAHGSLIRASLVRITTEKRAKKIRFYRNGDRFFKGMIYAVSAERFRTFEALMSELTTGPIGDKTVLPKGVRHMFTLDGSKKITDLEQLEEGASYVCASTQVFHKIDYPRSSNPNWSHNIIKHKDSVGESCTSPGLTPYDEEDREYIKPRLITVVGSGSKPRKAVRILLNKKTAHSFDQVLNDVTDAIKLDTGAVKRIFTIGGKQVSKCIVLL